MFEENPFEREDVAKQWISSVENEKDGFRDREIYPRLKSWKRSVTGTAFLEIGSGQGICYSQLGLSDQESYLGIEPSEPLVARAKQLYGRPN